MGMETGPNFKDSKQFGRLIRTVERMRDLGEPYRAGRLEKLKSIVGGSAQNPRAIQERAPVPLLGLAMGIVTRHLVQNNPRCLATTEVRDLRPEAKDLSKAIDDESKRMELGKVLRRAVSESYVGCGYVKVSRDHDRDELFVESVDGGDVFQSMTEQGTPFNQVSMVGDIYRMPLREAKATKGWKTDQLKPDTLTSRDERGRASSRSLVSNSFGPDDEFEDHVTLADIYVRHVGEKGQMITVGWNKDSSRDKPVYMEEWDGPKCGPYVRCELGLSVPGQPLPLAPATPLAFIDSVTNTIYADAMQRATEYKELYGVPLGSEDDIKRLNNGIDGQFFRMNSREPFQTIRLGTPDQAMFALGLELRNLFSWLAGNLDTLGGLSPQADTARQDMLLDQNASVMIKAYQQDVLMFVDEVMRSIGYWLWYDDKERFITRDFHGYQITSRWSKDERRGNWLDYSIATDPYSMTYRSPQERLALVGQIVQQYVMPMLPMMQQQGTIFRADKFLQIAAEYSNLPELDDMYVLSEPTEMQASSQQTAKPSSTTRNYVRTNRPGMNRQARDQAMAMAMLGNRQQPAQAARAVR